MAQRYGVLSILAHIPKKEKLISIGSYSEVSAQKQQDEARRLIKLWVFHSITNAEQEQHTKSIFPTFYSQLL